MEKGFWSKAEIQILKAFHLGQRKLKKATKGALEDVVSTLGKLAIVVAIISIVIGGIYIAVKPKIEAGSYTSDLQRILTGLEGYKNAYGRYPAGTGWGWNTNYAFVGEDIVKSGWQYSCSSNTIKITTPPINDAKVRSLVQAKFSNPSLCDSVSTSRYSIVCQLNNRPCW